MTEHVFRIYLAVLQKRERGLGDAQCAYACCSSFNYFHKIKYSNVFEKTSPRWMISKIVSGLRRPEE